MDSMEGLSGKQPFWIEGRQESDFAAFSDDLLAEIFKSMTPEEQYVAIRQSERFYTISVQDKQVVQTDNKVVNNALKKFSSTPVAAKNKDFVLANEKSALSKFHADEIDLRGVVITDALIDCLATQTTVKKIDLSRTRNLTPEQLERLSKLPNLSTLKLSKCQLTNEHLEKLTKFEKLSELDVSLNQFAYEGAREISKLTKLTWLDIAGNNLGREGAEEISSKLVNLTWLNLSGNNLRTAGVKGICKLDNLALLDIGGNDLRGFSSEDAGEITSKFPRLTSLIIRMNSIGPDAQATLKTWAETNNAKVDF